MFDFNEFGSHEYFFNQKLNYTIINIFCIIFDTDEIPVYPIVPHRSRVPVLLKGFKLNRTSLTLFNTPISHIVQGVKLVSGLNGSSVVWLLRERDLVQVLYYLCGAKLAHVYSDSLIGVERSVIHKLQIKNPFIPSRMQTIYTSDKQTTPDYNN